MSDVDKFHTVLAASGVEYAALSWNGFNLFGDRRSIDEAKRLLHEAGMLPAFRQQLLDTNRLWDDARKRIEDYDRRESAGEDVSSEIRPRLPGGSDF